MEKSTSPSKESPTKSPSPPPQNPPSDHDTPIETNPEAERIPPQEPIMKTALEVLAELSAGDEDLGGNNDGATDGGNNGAGGQAGGSVAMVVVDGSMVVEGGGGMSSDGHIRKRPRNFQVRDPPQGTPTCPECGKEFSTWKAAFGHMRKHPERAHRGFFPPPSFDCPTNTFVPDFDEGPGPGDKELSLVRKLVSDLSQSLEKGGSSHDAGAAGSSQAAAGSSQGDAGSSQDAAGRENASTDDKKGKSIGIDLNQPPPPEDDDDHMNEN